MSRYCLSPEAKADLAELADYIALDSPETALRVVRELRAAAQKLAPDRRPLEIVRVLRAARDVRAILSLEEL